MLNDLFVFSFSDDEAVVGRVREEGGELNDEDEPRVPILQQQIDLASGFGWVSKQIFDYFKVQMRFSGGHLIKRNNRYI